MKKYLLIILALAMGEPSVVSARSLTAQASTATVPCEPAYCIDPVIAGDELTQGMMGYQRQIQRVLESEQPDQPVMLSGKVS
ncbi:hypothetical protein [Erwinia mallotivora]|uniref:Uncharacterized protein n=1 Tax=Erwinia mallotivora TaxID=69222 RepID=A0A014NS50_9GAMM|nr:hypothetical protein [Erwinia mallotivora]EXU76685.1 hypothetical protein BG55_04070 [Erwinia mallotivora]